MEKKIIAGLAVLLLSASAAVAQSSMSSNSPKAGTPASSSNSMQSNTASDTSAAATTPKTHRRMASRYPRGEARLNADEAQTTKELNIQESQEVASNRGVGSTSSSSGNEMNGSSNASADGNTMSGGVGSSTSSSERGSAAQPQ